MFNERAQKMENPDNLPEEHFRELSSKILLELSGTLLFPRNSEKRFLKIKKIASACF